MSSAFSASTDRLFSNIRRNIARVSLLPRLFFTTMSLIFITTVLFRAGLISPTIPVSPVFFHPKPTPALIRVAQINPAQSFTIFTIFNQSCQLTQLDLPPKITAKPSTQIMSEVWWLLTGCTDGITNIRVVKSALTDQFFDSKAASSETFTDDNAAYTILNYGSDTINYSKARYQLVLATPLLKDDSLFTPLSASATKSQDNSLYYLSNKCKIAQTLCQLWKFDRITGQTQMIWSSASYNMVNFSGKTNDKTVLLSGKKLENTDLIIISSSDPNIISISQE